MTSLAVTKFNTGSPLTVLTTAETVVLSGPSVPINNPTGEGVGVWGGITITPGAGTTALVIRVRLGSLTGTVVSNQTVAATAAVNDTHSFYGLDTTLINPPFPAIAPGTPYVVTVVQTGATGNGTVNDAMMMQEPATVSVG